MYESICEGMHAFAMLSIKNCNFKLTLVPEEGGEGGEGEDVEAGI